MNTWVLIVAGGEGVRMGSTLPKQFMPLLGWPVLMHTVQAFYEYDQSINIIIILPDGFIDAWKGLCKQNNFLIQHTLVKGGKTRFHSVRNGLMHAGDEGLIAIHDGVRPLVNRTTIDRCFKTAALKGSAVPVLLPVESVRKVDGQYSIPVSREDLRLVQTPQVFRAGEIKQAYRRKYSSSFTDDATVAEKAGIKIHLVMGNPENIKITTPMDLKLAECLISGMMREKPV